MNFEDLELTDEQIQTILEDCSNEQLWNALEQHYHDGTCFQEGMPEIADELAEEYYNQHKSVSAFDTDEVLDDLIR